jgi:tRNA pseudouridine38-40 synthase
MKEAAQYLVGEHDFKSFCSVHTQALTTTREITAIEVFERPCEEERAAELVDEGVSFENYESACESADNPDVENPDANKRNAKKPFVRPAQRRGVSPREIVIRVSGTGFLYNMVRIIAGTLMEAGRGAIEPEKIKEILKACDREKAGPTAPPEGLTLVRYEILE